MATVDQVGAVWQPPLAARANPNILSKSVVQGRETRVVTEREVKGELSRPRESIRDERSTRAREDGRSDAEVSVPSVVMRGLCERSPTAHLTGNRALTSSTEIYRISIFILPCLTPTFLVNLLREAEGNLNSPVFRRW
jgi:hypothetical protein